MDETERFKRIKETIRNISDQKIRLEERFEREKENLEKLVNEIKKEGYDPKKLTEIRIEKEKLLQKRLTEIEDKIKNTQNKLNAMEPK